MRLQENYPSGGLSSLIRCDMLTVMRTLSLSFRRPNGMRGLFIIWLGQMVSGIASSITSVALPIWIFSITESGTAVGILEFFFFSAYLIAVPFAGILIDRSNRKSMMLVYDFLSLVALTLLLFIQTMGLLEVWHLYLAAVFQGIGSAFQSPSYAAAITTMVSKPQYIRANGLISLLYEIPGIFGPLLAGVLYLAIGLNGILAINLLAFVISIGVLLFVEIPQPPKSVEGELSHSRFLSEAFYGIKYIATKAQLAGSPVDFFYRQSVFRDCTFRSRTLSDDLITYGGQYPAPGCTPVRGCAGSCAGRPVPHHMGRD